MVNKESTESSKAVMISIKPEYCMKIANGEKTIEVRKTIPKMDIPFKVYIYCTEKRPYLNWHNGKVCVEENDKLGDKGYGFYQRLNGKVIGEFMCYNIDEIDIPHPAHFKDYIGGKHILEQSCLSLMDLHGYLGDKTGFGWNISELTIYAKPKTLNEFKMPCLNNGNCDRCKCWRTLTIDDGYCDIGIVKRPPQSWCYVEERGENSG